MFLLIGKFIKDGDIVKETFLEAVDGLFDDFKNNGPSWCMSVRRRIFAPLHLVVPCDISTVDPGLSRPGDVNACWFQ